MRATHLWTLLLAVALPARADPPFASIVAIHTAAGWFFEAEVDADPGLLPDAALTPPGGSPVALGCTTSTDADSCFVTDPPVEGPGFATLAALLASHPAGSYLLSIDGGALTAHLDFAPVEPDGSVHVTSPADGARSVDDTPTLAYTQDCDSCGFLFFEIDGFGSAEGVSLETTRIGTPPLASSGSVPYSELTSSEGPKPAALPDGSYRLSASAGVGSLTTETFDQGGELGYGTGAEQRTTTLFTVPEPGTWPAAVASLVALCARVRRDGRGVRNSSR
jgi:hypothetical protein